MKKIGVIGAGAFGTAMANHLATKGHSVILWAREPEVVTQIRDQRQNRTFLPKISLKKELAVTSDLQEVCDGKELILFAVPSQFLRRVLQETKTLLGDSLLASVSKGIEVETQKLLCQVFEEVLPERFHGRIGYLSGPTFAREFALDHPAAVDLASYEEKVGMKIQEIFRGPHFRLHWTSDVVGVELGGAIKNVIAVACGISDGLGYSDTTRAMLITWGLSEIMLLGEKMGAKRETFHGFSGIGDLLLTCGGELSRNKTFGLELAKGKSLAEIQASRLQVAEGVPTAKAVHLLSQKLKVHLPICEKVYRILYENAPPQELFA